MTCIKLYLGGVRKRDRGIGLLNPLNVFVSPNIDYTSIRTYIARNIETHND